MKPNLAVKVGKLRLKNPVMAASGTFGEEYGELVDIGRLGAVVAKTITLEPRTGNPPPRIVETPSGMLNSVGLENKGLDDFVKNKLPGLKKFGVPVIASIAGERPCEFKKQAERLDGIAGIAAVELNLSCPNVKSAKADGRMIAQDDRATYEVVAAVRKSTNLTVIAKLSPNVTDITKIAKAAETGGADAVSLVNTFLGMALDIESGRPVLGNITGGLSGPAIKPIALRMVWEAYNAVDIPIVGIGGIMDYKDAIEFILCGASALQVGTASFVNPSAAVEIVGGIENYLCKNKIGSIRQLTGALRLG